MNSFIKIITTITILFLIILSFIYFNIFIPINASKYPINIEIKEGDNLYVISNKLYNEKIIRNKFIFENFIKLTKQDSFIKAGEYRYNKPLNTIQILNKLVSGNYEYIPIILTIKEGEDSNSIVDKIYNNFKNVNNKYSKEELLKILQNKEGYLFPETYNYNPSSNIDQILNKIDNEFNKRVLEKYTTSTSTEYIKKIIIIASILEKEVPKHEDMKIVSGIIQNRLKKNMPLQMDSTLGYITGKGSLQLTLQDLATTSSYNTYKVKGLPSGPIGNPGDIAIEAAINPDKHDYLYFLSDKNGLNHYARTYNEHLRNRRLYLQK